MSLMWERLVDWLSRPWETIMISNGKEYRLVPRIDWWLGRYPGFRRGMGEEQ